MAVDNRAKGAWSRSDRIAITAVGVAVVAGLITIFVPEARRFFGFPPDPAPPAPAPPAPHGDDVKVIAIGGGDAIGKASEVTIYQGTNASGSSGKPQSHVESASSAAPAAPATSR